MTATPEELLRLARKAFPTRPELGEDERDVPGSIEPVGHKLELCSAVGAQIIALPGDHPRRIEGLHALLLVLSGELDVADLLADRDRLQARLAGVGRFDATGDGNSRCAGCGFAVCGEPRRLTVTLPKEEP